MKKNENLTFGKRETQYFCCSWFQTNHKIKVSWEKWGSEGLDTPGRCGQPEDGRCAGLPPGRSSRAGDYSRAGPLHHPRHQSCRHRAQPLINQQQVQLQWIFCGLPSDGEEAGSIKYQLRNHRKVWGKSMYSSPVVIWKYFLLKEPCSVLLTTAWCRENRTFSVMNLIIKYVQIFIINCTQKSY